ncbi:MAG TPA: FAD-dependent oxidoreductase [Candidatus Polarisedimenticolia bacterium]|nr:FAD-dependent oxidoreductase [Candidatus Polarisedimenticolia bacterium]
MSPSLSRRALLKGGAALAALGALGPIPRLAAGVGAPDPAPIGPRARDRPHVVVVGAGAFGGWSALFLLRRGARVTLIDAWGPGNSRASSGGETRVIRATYGPDRTYVRMVARALVLWKEHQARFKRPLWHRIGVLWMAGADDRYEKASLPLLREAGLPIEELSAAESSRRYPQINFEGVNWVLHEKEAGYLLARRACQAVLEGFLAEGGEYRQAAATPGAIKGGTMQALALSDGTTLAADRYLFACGPWLGSLLPDVVGARIAPTRQEVFFFGTPAGDARFVEEKLPAWIDNGARIFYGIPGNEWRGFKVADDTRGPAVDPTTQERMPSGRALRAAREYLEFRFPGMKQAPLVETRVCQYENSPDSRFIIDRHPLAENAFIAGGGSGHGFKHGPAIGEMAADLVLGRRPPDPFFALARLAT